MVSESWQVDEKESTVHREGSSIWTIGVARSGLLIAERPEDHNRQVLAGVKAEVSVQVPSLSFRIC